MGGWRWWLMVGEGMSSPSKQFQDFCHLVGPEGMEAVLQVPSDLCIPGASVEE